MDTETVKAILQIKTEKHDTYISVVLPLFVGTVKEYCGQTFTIDGVELLPSGVQIAIAKWIEYNMQTAGVAGRSQGVSYSYSTELPGSIKTLLKPHRKLRFP